MDARSFWEYYSRGFEACVKEGQVFTVMCSYNAMNGIPTTASQVPAYRLAAGTLGIPRLRGFRL